MVILEERGNTDPLWGIGLGVALGGVVMMVLGAAYLKWYMGARLLPRYPSPVMVVVTGGGGCTRQQAPGRGCCEQAGHHTPTALGPTLYPRLPEPLATNVEKNEDECKV